MKHCFIINPASGKATTKEGLENRIRQACEAAGEECFVLTTERKGDAPVYIKDFYDEHGSDDIRFYACGGDGTLCEVINGVMKLERRDNVSVGVIPVGTGNDFVRNFTPSERFFDIGAQIAARPVPIDLLRCNELYAINMINIGFDCQVVVKTDKFKRKKWMPSKLAYICGLVVTLIKKPGVSMTVSVDGGESEHKRLLLTTFANGCFCGGGFHSNPLSQLCDGKIDTIFVNNVSRTRFIMLVGDYKKGTHLSPKFEKVLTNAKSESFRIEFDSTTSISVDGEIFEVDSIDMSCERGALRFLIPEGVECAVLGLEKQTASV